MREKVVVKEAETWTVECAGEVRGRGLSGDEETVGPPGRLVDKGVLEERLETLGARRLQGMASELIELAKKRCILLMFLEVGLVGDGIDTEDTLNQRLWK